MPWEREDVQRILEDRERWVSRAFEAEYEGRRSYCKKILSLYNARLHDALALNK